MQRLRWKRPYPPTGAQLVIWCRLKNPSKIKYGHLVALAWPADMVEWDESRVYRVRQCGGPRGPYAVSLGVFANLGWAGPRGNEMPYGREAYFGIFQTLDAVRETLYSVFHTPSPRLEYTDFGSGIAKEIEHAGQTST